MKRYHINKTLIRDHVHDLDLMISEKALEQLESLVGQAVDKICTSTSGDERKIVRPADLKALVPYVQLTFGSRKPAGTRRSRAKRTLGGENEGKTEETYVTA